MLSAIGEIRRDDGCFDYAGKSVVIYPCHGQRGNQEWQYTPVSVYFHIYLCRRFTQNKTARNTLNYSNFKKY